MKVKQDMYGRAIDPEAYKNDVTLPHPGAPLDTEDPQTAPAPVEYHRTDEEILDDACRTLETHSELDVSNMEIEVKSSEVTLKGTVPEKWMKQVTGDLAECVLGVKRVHNALVVKGSLKEQLLGDTRDKPPEPGSVSRDPAAPVVAGGVAR